MKKILLSAGMLLLTLATQAQECKAVATLNEDFSDFTISSSFATAFPQNCWSANGSVTDGPWIYTAETTDKANQYVTFYSHRAGANVAGYVISPELSSIDGKHQLSFDTYKPLGPDGQAAAGSITVQVGTLTSPTDLTTFEAVGNPIEVTGERLPYANIVIPASTTKKYIAFKYISATTFNAATLDNVVWSEIPAPPCEAVATLDENFSTFTTGVSFPLNCWTASQPYPVVSVSATGEAQIYSSELEIATPIYLVTPELSTIDGKHALTYDAKLSNGTTVTVQAGTLTDATDYTTFAPFGDVVTLTKTGTSVPEFVVPTSTTQKYIAFKVISAAKHNVSTIDNVKWVAKTAGVNDFAKNKFSIFPNPSSTKNVTVAYTGTDKANVTVYSVTGAKVFETAINGTNANLNLSSLSSGMYIVKLTAGNATATQKLVIQ